MSFRRNRKIPGRVTLLFSSAAMLLGACGGDDVEQDMQVVRPVRTAVVTTAPTTIQRTYPAVVLPAQQAELAFKVSGRIVDLPVRAAAQVEEGEVIAQLDKREFEAAVARLESQRKAAEAQLDKQRKQLERLQQLVNQGTIARAEFEKERAQLTSDEAAVSELDTQLSEAKADLDETTLRAPFDGIIASRNVDNFTNVQANAVVAVLQTLETLDLQYDVPGIDVANFAQQENVVTKARLDAAPGREFEAQLVEFGTQADAATQTFRARASIPYPEDVTVLPGMTGSIIVSAQQQDLERFVIPESALAAEPDGSSYVWVVNQQENAVTRRKVTPQSLAGGDVSVSGDLKEGETVVTAGVSFLREGMIVNPTTEGMK